MGEVSRGPLPDGFKVYDFAGTVRAVIGEEMSVIVDTDTPGEAPRPFDAMADEVARAVLKEQGVVDSSGEAARLLSIAARTGVGRLLQASGFTVVRGNPNSPDSSIHIGIPEPVSHNNNQPSVQGER